MAGQALSTSQCTPNVLLYLPNHAVNAHQRAGHASFQQHGEYGTTPGDITPRMYPNARAYAKKVLASQGVFHLDTAPSWPAHPRPAPHPTALDANAGGNYLTGDVSHTHLRHHLSTPAAVQGHTSHGHAYQFANMQGLHPNNVVTTLTLDPNFLPSQFSGSGMGGANSGGGAYAAEVNCASQNVSLGPRTNSRCDSVRSEAAESSCSSLSADSQSDYMGGASTATFNHQLNQSWYTNYRGNASSSSSAAAAAAMTGNVMNYGNACNGDAHSAAGSHYAKTSNFPNRPYNCHWSYAENNVNSAGISPQQQHHQQRYMNYAWSATHAMNTYARNPVQHNSNAYWASATPTQAQHHHRRDVNQNEMKECWNVMQNQSNGWAKYAPPTSNQTNYAPLASDTPCGRGYGSVGMASVEESQTVENEDQGDKEYDHRDMGGEVCKTDDVSTGSVTCMVPPQRRESCSNNSDNSQVLANSSDDLAVAKVKVKETSEENGESGRSSSQTVVTPWGWERLIINDAVIYVSPSGTRLHCCQELRQYLQQNGTCKCGLPCPLRLNQVFDFNPVVSCNSATSPPTWEFCSHNRSCSDAKTVPITASCGENESENTPSGTEESTPPANAPAGTNSTTSSTTPSTKSQKSNKRSAAGTPPGQKSKKVKLATPSGANTPNQTAPSSSTTSKRRSPCPNVDVRQLSVEYNRPPVGGYLASLSQPRCPSISGNTGHSTSSIASPKTSIPSFMEDPSGYLAQQTVLLHSTIACQSGIENEKLTFSPNKNQGTSTPVKTPPVTTAPLSSPSAPSYVAPPTPNPAQELPECTKNTSTTGSEVEAIREELDPEPEAGREPETSEFIGDLLDCIPDSMELSSDGLSANESKDSGYKSFAGLIPSSSSSLSVSDTPPQPAPAEPPILEVPFVSTEATKIPAQVPVPTPPSVVSTTNGDTPTESAEPSKPAPKQAPKVKSARKATANLSKKSRKSASSQSGLSKSPKMKKLSPVLTPTTPQPLYTTTGPFMGGVNPATNCWSSHAFGSNDRLTHTRSVLPTMAPHTPMVQVLNVNGAILQPSMDNANPVILQAPPSFVPSARDSTGGRCIMPRIEAPPGHPSATPLNHPPPPSKPSRGKKRKSAPQTVASILHGVQSNPSNAMNSWGNPTHTQPMPATPSTDLQQQFQATTCLPIPFSGGQMGSLNSNVPTLALMPDGKTYVVLNQLNPQPQPFNSGTITLNAFNTVHSVSTLQGPWLVNPSVNMNPLITTANLNLSLVQNQGMPTFVVPQGVIVNQLPDGTLVGTDPNVQLQIQNVATMVNQNAGAGTHNHGNALVSSQQTQQLLRSNEPPRPGLPGGAMSKVKSLGAISSNQVGAMPVQTVVPEQRLATVGNGLMRQATATQTSRSLSPDSQTSVTSTLERDGSISRGEATPPGLTLVAATAEQSPVVQSCLIDSCVTEESPSGGGTGVAGAGGGVNGNGRGEETESDLDDGISSSKVLEFNTSQVALQTPTPMVMAVPLAATQQIV